MSDPSSAFRDKGHPYVASSWFAPAPFIDLEVRVKTRWWQRRRVLPCKVVGLHSGVSALTVTLNAVIDAAE